MCVRTMFMLVGLGTEHFKAFLASSVLASVGRPRMAYAFVEQRTLVMGSTSMVGPSCQTLSIIFCFPVGSRVKL